MTPGSTRVADGDADINDSNRVDDKARPSAHETSTPIVEFKYRAARVVGTTWTAHRCVAVDWTRDGEPAGRRIFWLELESRWGRAEKGIA